MARFFRSFPVKRNVQIPLQIRFGQAVANVVTKLLTLLGVGT